MEKKTQELFPRIQPISKQEAEELNREFFINVECALEYLSHIYGCSVPKWFVSRQNCAKKDQPRTMCRAFYTPLKAQITTRTTTPTLKDVVHEFVHHVQYLMYESAENEYEIGWDNDYEYELDPYELNASEIASKLYQTLGI